MAQTIGVVLAGGAGRRMGGPKGELRVDGMTLAERAAKTLRPLCGSVLISVPHGGRNPAPGYAAIEDELPERRGPLAGIAAAFASSGRADLFVLACDYPAVESELFRVLRDLAEPWADVVLPTDASGRDHPLVALWRRGAERAVRAALDADSRRVSSVFPEVEVQRISAADLGTLGVDVKLALTNVNWPSDLEGLGVGRP